MKYSPSELLWIRQYAADIRKALNAVRSPAKRVKALHALRVGIRRLGNMLWISRRLFSKRKLKQWRGALRQIADATSASRDQDVYVSFLKRYRKRLRSREQRKIMGTLISDVQSRRQTGQVHIGKAVHDFKKQGALSDIFLALKKLSGASNKAKTNKIYKVCRKAVHKRVQQLSAYDAIVHQPRQVEALHQMRIAAKHLRYSLEGIQELYGKELLIYVEAVLSFHRQLGDIHDCDVWQEEINTYLKKKKWTPRERGVFLHLRKYLQQQRTKVYRAFVRNWTRCKKDRVLEELIEYMYASE